MNEFNGNTQRLLQALEGADSEKNRALFTEYFKITDIENNSERFLPYKDRLCEWIQQSVMKQHQLREHLHETAKITQSGVYIFFRWPQFNTITHAIVAIRRGGAFDSMDWKRLLENPQSRLPCVEVSRQDYETNPEGECAILPVPKRGSLRLHGKRLHICIWPKVVINLGEEQLVVEPRCPHLEISWQDVKKRRPRRKSWLEKWMHWLLVNTPD